MVADPSSSELANRLLIGPLLSQDGVAVEAEQEGYEARPDAPMIEVNPAIARFQDLTIRKWEEHLAEKRQEVCPCPES